MLCSLFPIVVMRSTLLLLTILAVAFTKTTSAQNNATSASNDSTNATSAQDSTAFETVCVKKYYELAGSKGLVGKNGQPVQDQAEAWGITVSPLFAV